jgi:hypothetical protein
LSAAHAERVDRVSLDVEVGRTTDERTKAGLAEDDEGGLATTADPRPLDRQARRIRARRWNAEHERPDGSDARVMAAETSIFDRRDSTRAIP